LIGLLVSNQFHTSCDRRWSQMLRDRQTDRHTSSSLNRFPLYGTGLNNSIFVDSRVIANRCHARGV